MTEVLLLLVKISIGTLILGIGMGARWFFPCNFMVGKLLTRSVVTSVEIGIPIVDDYQVYDFKLEARVGFFF